ncbi:DUF4383 domain-containing protein [Kineococcus sp. R8]|uniref:DUF4383 domain-containing protein n=1 Tax=Kineococcus siccus TaxID=2696567 RepID=UPI0014126B95|nr:DUF4383 domain-containing protein [Kineococcus siccus]NAZ81637.1 DUF4383 domain-containing protein [Kineococcus siccus]
MSTLALEGASTTNGPITKYARAVGGFLVLLGVLSLVPGITTNYAGMGFYSSEAQLFGLFTTSIVASAVYLGTGACCIAFSTSPRQGHKTVVLTGLLFIVVAVGGAGLVVNPSPPLPVNEASNWLHLVMGFLIPMGAARARAKHVEKYGVF